MDARIRRRSVMAIVWSPIKSGPKDLLKCTGCGAKQFQIRSEPVKRKRHARMAHRRRIVAICKTCGKLKRLAFGAARGRQKGRRKSGV